MSDRFVYKLLNIDELDALRRDGTFPGSPLDQTDGFIHLSSAAQVTGTVDKYFPDLTNLMVAAIDTTRLGDALRWEPSRGGQLFPHLYAPLSRDAVVAVIKVKRLPDGTIHLPA